MPFVVSLVFVVGITGSTPLTLPIPQTTPLRACALLTKDLALKVTASADKRIFDMFPPDEEQIGANGTACEYGDIGLQIDPFTPAGLERSVKEQGPQWSPVPKVGDRAWFRDNRGLFAELVVIVGTHTLTVQMSVPAQRTAEQIKPNTITLVNELVPKLR
jgi:hypothetical protein